MGAFSLRDAAKGPIHIALTSWFEVRITFSVFQTQLS